MFLIEGEGPDGKAILYTGDIRGTILPLAWDQYIDFRKPRTGG